MSKANVVSISRTLPSHGGEGLLTSGGREKFADGGMEGAARLNRDTALWRAPDRSADDEIQRAKPVADPRARDLSQNNGYVNGGIETFKDSTVGAFYMLNADPDYKYLGLDEKWSEEWKDFVEAHWNLYAESDECLAHAAGRLTATEMIRMNVGTYIATGDALMSSEWLRGRAYASRPYATAFNLIDPTRLCNPNDQMDTADIRRGINIDSFGRPLGYYIRNAYRNTTYAQQDQFTWSYIAATKPWGRKMMLHLADVRRPEQTRAVSRLISSMREIRMLDKYSDVVLQNAIVNATYAATIESEMPRDIVFAQLGEMGSSSSGAPLGAGPFIDYMKLFLQAAAEYQGGSKNLALDGVRIPHLLPGTKLNLQNAGNPGGIGTGFENSFLRVFCRSLGISFEEFSGNFSESNYSAARASMTVTERTMRAVKRSAADRSANFMFTNFIEELINQEGSNAPLPKNAPNFYDAMNKSAYCKANWIGSARGQIDEMKETQAAILRINAGISCVADEAARLGKDWRRLYRQRGREKSMADEFGLVDTQDIRKDTGKAVVDPNAQDNQDNQDNNQ